MEQTHKTSLSDAHLVHVELAVPYAKVALSPPPPPGRMYLLEYGTKNVAIDAADPGVGNAPTTAEYIRISLAPSLHHAPPTLAVPTTNLKTNANINNPKTGAAYAQTTTLPPDNNGVTITTTGLPASTGVGFVIPASTSSTPLYGSPKKVPFIATLPANTNYLELRADDYFGRAITFDRLHLVFGVLPNYPKLHPLTPTQRSAVAAARF